MKEILIGIVASMFFAVTFILNRSIDLAGGSWLWSSSLRYFFMVPFLVMIVYVRGNLKQLFFEMRKNLIQWFLWSFVGFVLFYAPITYAASFGPGWLISGTWQLTILAGILLGPLFYHTIQTETGELLKVRHRIPVRALAISSIIVIGVILIQFQHTSTISILTVLYSVFPVLIAAFAYPLGNRKMMDICGGKLDTFQRVLGMTLATIPVWIALAVYGYISVGPPPLSQISQSFIVAISSGVIATTLFFIATDRVRENHTQLAAVEATQSTQVIFVIIGEMLILSAPFPPPIALFGLSAIMLGMILHSLHSRKGATPLKKEKMVAN